LVRIISEAVPANCHAIKEEIVTKKDVVKKSVKEIVDVRSSSVKRVMHPEGTREDLLELNADGDIVSVDEAPIVPEAQKPSATRVGDKSEMKGWVRGTTPTPLKTLLGKDGLHCSDQELINQSLIAWRHHLRCQDNCKPDKMLPIELHEAHVRILMSALSSFKGERIRNNLVGRAKTNFMNPNARGQRSSKSPEGTAPLRAPSWKKSRVGPIANRRRFSRAVRKKTLFGVVRNTYRKGALRTCKETKKEAGGGSIRFLVKKRDILVKVTMIWRIVTIVYMIQDYLQNKRGSCRNGNGKLGK
jgi:hypothetical protein